SSGELAVDGLVGLIFTASLVGSASAGCDIRCDIPAVLRGAVYTTAGAVPHSAQVGMAVRRARNRRLRRSRRRRACSLLILAQGREQHATCNGDKRSKAEAQ